MVLMKLSILSLILFFLLLLLLPWVEFIPHYPESNQVECREGMVCPMVAPPERTGFEFRVTLFFGAKYFWKYYSDAEFPRLPTRLQYKYDVFDDSSGINTFSFLALFLTSAIIAFLSIRKILNKHA